MEKARLCGLFIKFQIYEKQIPLGICRDFPVDVGGSLTLLEPMEIVSTLTSVYKVIFGDHA